MRGVKIGVIVFVTLLALFGLVTLFVWAFGIAAVFPSMVFGGLVGAVGTVWALSVGRRNDPYVVGHKTRLDSDGSDVPTVD